MAFKSRPLALKSSCFLSEANRTVPVAAKQHRFLKEHVSKTRENE